jgi:hypothetical protein
MAQPQTLTRAQARRRPPRWRLFRWTLFIAIVVLLVDFLAPFRHSIWNQVSLSIIRKQPAYNALYFTRPADLPSQVPTGVVSRFSFDIRRVGPPTKARYTIQLSDATGTTLLTGRDVSLRAGKPIVISEQFSVPVSGAFEVGVTLSSHHTQIEFHGDAS